MMITLTHNFRFEAARRLTRLPDGHPCGRVHGHGFVVEVEVAGELDPEAGWLIDYADLARAWEAVAGELDHRYLNDVPGLENPTSELIAVWIWRRLEPGIPCLAAVSVLETPATRATYRGDPPRARSGETGVSG